MKNIFAILCAVAFLGFGACTGDDTFQNEDFATSDGSTVTGSYSRILTVGNYLYAVDQTDLITFDIADRANPAKVDRQEIGLAIETIYHFNGHLFIGSREAMYTYTLSSNGIPARRGQFNYSNLPGLSEPCDPVVADEETAYSTLYTQLESVDPCGRDQNAEMLVVMDIQDLDNPTLVTTYDLQTPRGLSLAEDILFVCNDANGLTVLDVSDRSQPALLSHVEGISAWDAIVSDGNLVVVGTSEVVQFDFSDPTQLVELSRIPLPRT